MKALRCRRCFLFIYFISFSFISNAQQNYWVFLKDKHNCTFNPTEYFDIKAIERRVNSGISLMDSSDYPVNQYYLTKVEKMVDSIYFASRWLNAIAIQASKQEISKLRKCSFVKEILWIKSKAHLCSSFYDTSLNVNEKNILSKQISLLEGQYFFKNKINGNGIRIAVFDGGFPGVNEIPIFRHLLKDKGIISTFDFARNKAFVYSHNPHGTAVLSCIAGKIGKLNLGLATNAEFLLARTEINREPKEEEIHWVEALEWADKLGVQIINSSIGYTYHRYFPEDMNGETSIVSKAASMAARKGILIVSSMGNDGQNDWKVLSTPADADSILSVGAIDPILLYHSSFSSFGPTADFRLKPNVVASGQVISAGPKVLKISNGTSFSTPLISGFAACVWQMHPEYTNMDVLREIEKSASLYPYFDYAHGYGIPKASYFFQNSSQELNEKETFKVKVDKNTLTVLFNKEKQMKRINTDYLYFHVADLSGKILEYSVIDIENLLEYKIPYRNLDKNLIIRIFYRGTVKEFKINDL